MRVFIAIEISEELRLLVKQRIEFLRLNFPNLRVGWEKPEKLHLTLKFLGEIEENRLADLIAATEKATNEVSPFNLTIAGTGAFNKRILWLGVKDESGNLGQINKRLENECSILG